MTDTPITLTGNLAADPELRFSAQGRAIANLRVLSTPRRFDKQANDWVDGETLGMNCTVFGEAAENVAESLTKGAAVVVVGKIVSRSWENQAGEKRSSIEVLVDDIGPSLRRATAKVTRAQRSGGHAQPAAAPQSDPWGTPPPADTPPF